MNNGANNCLLVLCAILFLTSCGPSDEPEYPGVIPTPKEYDHDRGVLCFDQPISFFVQPTLQPLEVLLADELFLLFKQQTVKTSEQSKASILIELDNDLKAGEYQIEIDDKIHIKAYDYESAAMATITMEQMIAQTNNGLCISKGSIRDRSDLQYRGLLVDVSRREHGIESIKQIIKLCRWYKLNYLQLHLTDDQAFTFPSSAYPALVTKEQHFTRSQLDELVEYARLNGIQLVPEIDVPGHASPLVKNMPQAFGFAADSLNRSTINMGREAAYEVLDSLVGEIAQVFKYSSYIHIGGDEADFTDFENDPDIRIAMNTLKLDSVQQLYWRLINRMDSSVRKRGRKTIVWEGFSREANTVINKDITVMAWETMYQLPQHLLADSFHIINVSWKPLYVVNKQKWSTADIFNWNVYRWQNWLPAAPSYTPIQIDPHPAVTGGSMASWDQPEYSQLSSLRKRIPAMVENLWNTEKVRSRDNFVAVMNEQDRKLSLFLSPVRFSASGLYYSNISDGRNDEQTWFDDTVQISLSSSHPGQIHYTTDGTDVTEASPVYKQPVLINNTSWFKYRSYGTNGKPLGTQTSRFFEYHPLHITYTADFTIHPDSLWETARSWLIPYEGSVVISLRAPTGGVIKYSVTREGEPEVMLYYSRPLVLTDTAVLKVQAGVYKNDKLVGKRWVQYFRREG